MVGGKLTPTGVVERRNIFKNSLLAIVKNHHKEHCRKLGINVKDGEVKKFHPDFEVDKVPEVEITDLPPKPDLEKVIKACPVPLQLSVLVSVPKCQRDARGSKTSRHV